MSQQHDEPDMETTPEGEPHYEESLSDDPFLAAAGSSSSSSSDPQSIPPELTDDDSVGESIEERGFKIEETLEELIKMFSDSRGGIIGGGKKIDREKVLETLVYLRENFPEEIRAARWLIKERKLYIERVRREGDEIIQEARNQATRMVQRTEVVQEANIEARRIVEEAEAESAGIKNEMEHYCETRLSGFQNALGKILESVREAQKRFTEISPDTYKDLSTSQYQIWNKQEYEKEPGSFFEKTERQDPE